MSYQLITAAVLAIVPLPVPGMGLVFALPWLLARGPVR
jgi:hypothetical protein